MVAAAAEQEIGSQGLQREVDLDKQVKVNFPLSDDQRGINAGRQGEGNERTDRRTDGWTGERPQHQL